MNFNHIPVLLEETIDGLNIKEDGIYVDGTLGGGGHSFHIVSKLKEGKLIGIDQDLNALKKAREVLKPYEENTIFVHNNYVNIPEVLDGLNIDRVDGVLLDIGVSSHQLDEEERGFSYHKDAPLDMRMDRTKDFSAWNVVNEYSVEELNDIIFNYGEERWAKRISEFIVEERKSSSIDTTFQLVEVIKKAVPKKAREKEHPAKKTFQGIRIEVNGELDVLKNSIPKIVERLNKGGRLAIITFHSLEDRIVKNIFKDLNKQCICPPEIPICVCDKKREVKLITRKPIAPTEEEIKENRRSRSSKLRVVEKC